MSQKDLFKLVLLALFGFLFLISACEKKTEITKIVQPELAAYVGSQACQSCHSTIYDSFKKTGHPYKLNPADSVEQNPNYFPFVSQFPGPPPGKSWSDISYVIGGFWWKARFMDQNGYIITGDQVQYNLATQQWVPYEASVTNKKYDCGPCHTTGYDSAGHQDGLEGIVGTWAFPGIQCEECHGPGSVHAQSPKDHPLKTDRSSTLCSKCHVRGTPYKIPAKGGFVDHHEQFNEIMATNKFNMPCVDCHDPHVGLHALNPNRANAIKTKCETCHYEEMASFANTELPHYAEQVECIDCHMHYTGKSAVGDTLHHVGDVRSHLFRINIDPNAKMLSADGKFANGYLTVDYVCLRCHGTKDKAWALSNANRTHAEPVEPTACFECHGDTPENEKIIARREQWKNSNHATGETYIENESSCSRCHTSEGFVQMLQTGSSGEIETPSHIGCFTCHAPHSIYGTLKVRTEEAYTLENGVVFDKGEGNLCVHCHHSRRNVDNYVYDGVKMSTRFGPHHSNHGDMLQGTNAYEYSGVTYTNSYHSSGVPDGCVTCHMNQRVDYTLGGHSMNMTWGEEENEEENVETCNSPVCHNGTLTSFNRLAAEDYDGDGTIEGVQDEVEDLMDKLKDKLITANLLTGGGVPVARVVAKADSAGAVFNYFFVLEDRCSGIHNTKYAVKLLQSSLDYLSPSPISKR